MKLSEAIRLGAMLRPQAFRAFFKDELNGGGIGSCALGAAAEGIGLTVQTTLPSFARGINKLREKFPILDDYAKCQISGCILLEGHLVAIIAHMNDYHYMTREQIADEVERFEKSKEVISPAVSTSSPAPAEPAPVSLTEPIPCSSTGI